jgi:hypothetical protein
MQITKFIFPAVVERRAMFLRQSEQIRAGTEYHLLGAMRRIEERDRERFSQPPTE